MFYRFIMSSRLFPWAVCALLASCGAGAGEHGAAGDGGGTGGAAGDGSGTGGVPGSFMVVTFNTGTTEGSRHDDPPDDGYTSAHAAISDEWYGNGLAWVLAVEAARSFLAEVSPDIVAFQEVFYSEECFGIPTEARAGFVCETWSTGDPTVARLVLGEDYQLACHPGKPDKCAAVKRSFGSFRGCDEDFCLEGLTGFTVEGCGSGARVARVVVERTNGDVFTLVTVHGSSGVSTDDQDCRVRQVEQVFVDAGDREPGANGMKNLVLGDFNTDPGILAGTDPSADRWNDFVGDGKTFSFISEVGPDAPGAYLGTFDIDHVVSDRFTGSCWYAGVDTGRAAVYDGVYFDHVPVVCEVSQESPLVSNPRWLR